MTEYIGLNLAQYNFGKKNLLYSQMELLSILKRYQEYKKLRKQEIALKKLLKTKINDLHDGVANLDALLPKTKQEIFKPIEISKTQKKRQTIEAEIEELRHKISQLR